MAFVKPWLTVAGWTHVREGETLLYSSCLLIGSQLLQRRYVHTKRTQTVGEDGDLREHLLGIQHIRLAPVLVVQSQRSPLGLPVRHDVPTLRVPCRLVDANIAPDLVGTDVLLVLVDDGPPEATLQNDNGSQDEPRPDLDQRHLWRSILGLGLRRLALANLVHPDPDLPVDPENTNDPVDEWLHAPDTSARHTEHAAQHLPDQRTVFRPGSAAHDGTIFVKRAVKHHNPTTTLQTVAAKPSIQLAHGVHVVHVETDCWAVGRPGDPEVQVLAALFRLEEEDDIAGVKICQGVQKKVVSRLLLLRIQFRLFVRVRKERSKVCQ